MKKLSYLSYLLGPILLFISLLKVPLVIFIIGIILLAVYVILCVVTLVFLNNLIDNLDDKDMIPSHINRLRMKKAYNNGITYYIHKENSYNKINLFEWNGFFLRKIKDYPNFKSFVDAAKYDIDKYIEKKKSVDTYYGFDGFLTNEDRVAHKRDKKLNKLLSK